MTLNDMRAIGVKAIAASCYCGHSESMYRAFPARLQSRRFGRGFVVCFAARGLPT